MGVMFMDPKRIKNYLAKTERDANPPKQFLVSAAGFEPATHALKGHCSTT
jgi:hypothetical protein